MYHDAVPGIVADVFDELAALTGRSYGIVDYVGAPDAERVIVMIGVRGRRRQETVDHLTAAGERVGLLTIPVVPPVPVEAFLAALPRHGQLDRCARSHQRAGFGR